MTSTQKIIILINALGRFKRPDDLVIKDGKLYYATWEESYHNGDISNYKETLMEEKDAASRVNHLERLYAEQQWEAYVELEKKGFVEQLYVLSPKVHDLNETLRTS